MNRTRAQDLVYQAQRRARLRRENQVSVSVMAKRSFCRRDIQAGTPSKVERIVNGIFTGSYTYWPGNVRNIGRIKLKPIKENEMSEVFKPGTVLTVSGPKQDYAGPKVCCACEYCYQYVRDLKTVTICRLNPPDLNGDQPEVSPTLDTCSHFTPSKAALAVKVPGEMITEQTINWVDMLALNNKVVAETKRIAQEKQEALEAKQTAERHDEYIKQLTKEEPTDGNPEQHVK